MDANRGGEVREGMRAARSGKMKEGMGAARGGQVGKVLEQLEVARWGREWELSNTEILG